MPKTVLYLGLAATLAVVAWRLPAAAQSGIPATVQSAGGSLVTHFSESPDRTTMLTVLDPESRVISVYQLDPQTGEIKLKSVRNIRWDLALDAHNSPAPLPAEIRKMVQRQQALSSGQ